MLNFSGVEAISVASSNGSTPIFSAALNAISKFFTFSLYIFDLLAFTTLCFDVGQAAVLRI